MNNKWLNVFLLSLLIALQYRLWFGKNSLSDYSLMQSQIDTMSEQNARLAQRNQLLRADIDDLETGNESMEERARYELGLIREDEVFFRIVARDD